MIFVIKIGPVLMVQGRVTCSFNVSHNEEHVFKIQFPPKFELSIITTHYTQKSVIHASHLQKCVMQTVAYLVRNVCSTRSNENVLITNILITLLLYFRPITYNGQVSSFFFFSCQISVVQILNIFRKSHNISNTKELIHQNSYDFNEFYFQS